MSYPNYEEWLSDLILLAVNTGVDIELNKYSYHTYFMRGWLPESVLEDIKEGTASQEITV